jgi:transcriptional regulator with PAS, ATPase and Fis domain
MTSPPTAPHEWVQEFPFSVTVTDTVGIITEMNNAAVESFAADGGRALIGTSVLECHPERARAILSDLLASGRSNIYSIEKNGRKKLIVQSPWYRDGKYSGIVEISIELPETVPHFNRDAP